MSRVTDGRLRPCMDRDSQLPAATTRLWGCADIDRVFHGSDRVMLPWPRAPRSRTPRPTAPVGAPRLEPVDPRRLCASQPWVVRHHAAYYLTGVWERTGQTSAAMAAASNRYPVIEVDITGRHIIRTGHHRSLAALIEGRPVLARVIHASPVPPSSAEHSGLVLTPLLRVASAELAADALAELGLDPAQIEDRISMATTGRTLTNR